MTVGGIIVKPSADSLLSNGNLVLMLNMLAALLSVCHKHNMVDKTFFKWSMSVNCCLRTRIVSKLCLRTDVTMTLKNV